MICIYHNKDLDGYSSGAIVKRKFPDVKLIGWDYGNPIPNLVQGEEVIMIDISFPMKDMIEISKYCKLTWIDHHISAKKEYDAWEDKEKKNINYVYNLGVAACEIGWEYYFPDEPIPEAITLLGEYDTWRNQDKKRWEERILPFQFGMRNICTSPETFPLDVIGYGGMAVVNDICKIGEAILNYQRGQDTLACGRAAFERNFERYTAICLNQGAFSSETLKSVYDPKIHDIMIGFQFNGRFWNVSLRSIGDVVDCSSIAKRRGGGGHKNAAGFEAKTFEEIFVEKVYHTEEL